MDLSSVRIREHFGLVSNNTQTAQFSFLVSPPKNRASVEKHDYVMVDHPLLGEVCPILAVITEITSYEEVAGSTLGDKMGKMLATAEIIGYVDLRAENKPLCEVLIPPNSGCRVYIPLKKFLEDILNRNVKGEAFKTPIQMGLFEASSAEEQENNGRVKCLVDAQDFISRNTIITAVAGAGQTHIAKLLIQEISSKTSAQIILFDPYNEYQSALGNIAKISQLNSKMDKDALSKEIKKGQTTILKAQGLTPEEKRTFYNEALKILLQLEEKSKPVFLLIEEADNIKGETLDQVVAEGRKNGIFTCLLTTHPADLGSKILSQMGNQIIGRTTSKEDVEHLANVAGKAKVSLPNLRVGEWIINGIDAREPMKVQVILP
jgi:DNA helicase HerA-like ATPase